MRGVGKWLATRLAHGWFWQVIAGLLIGLGLVALDEIIEIIVLGSGHSTARSAAGRVLLEVLLFTAVGLGVVYFVMDRRRRTERLRWLTRAVEQSVNMVIITDLEGHAEYVNPKFTEVTGYSQDEALGQSPGLLESTQSTREEFMRLWDTVSRTGELRGERRNRRKNGEQYWESVLVSPLLNSEGVITHYLSIKEDITARKEAEEMERAQRAWSETLSEMAAVFNMSLDVSTIVDRILTFVGLVMPHTSGTLMLIDEQGFARVERVIGTLPETTRTHLMCLLLKVSEVPNLHWMYQTHEPIVIPAVDQSSDWVRITAFEWLKSFVAAPIWREGHVFGFISLYSEQPGFFNDTHMEQLQTFANHAAIALSNARLLGSEREQRIMAEELHAAAVIFSSTLDLDMVLDHVMSSVGRLVEHDAAFVVLLENGKEQLVRQHGYLPEELAAFEVSDDLREKSRPYQRQMINTLHPVLINDIPRDEALVEHYGEPRLRSFLAAPIVVSDRVIGMLGMQSTQAGKFNARDMERLQIFADQAALAIHNAQSHAAVQRQANDLGKLVHERTVEITRQRSHLQAILDSIGEGVIHLQNGQIVYTNRALCRMFGCVEGEFPNRLDDLSNLDMIGGADLGGLMRNAEAQLPGGHIWRSGLQVRRKDGTPFDVALTISRTGTAEADRALGVVIIVRDVSQEKALQEQKDRFITHAAHELRTPISNIKTRLYLLRQQPDQPMRHLDVIEDVALTMQNLVEDMLDLVRMERHSVLLRRQLVMLSQLVTDVVRRQSPFAERKGMRLDLEVSEADLTTCADYSRLQQALDRLVSTAIYLAVDQPRVVVSLSRDQVGSMPYVLIGVWYSGDSLTDDQIAHMFDPFFRANEGGSQGVGLGLTLAQQIVGLHQGEIWLERAPQGGMIFKVRLTLDRDCSQFLSLGSAASSESSGMWR